MSGPTDGHVVFAANLRRLCNSTTSIADICRDTGINRQQFNKYLAGRSVPSARVLRKICQRLGVSETVLLGEPLLADGSQESASAGAVSTPSRLARELDRLFFLFMPEAKSLKAAHIGFGAGAYHAYFSFAGVEGYLLRAYLETWWHNDTLLFTRMTKVREIGKKSRLVFQARHYGVVVPSLNEVSLVGRNRSPPYQISIINIDPTRQLDKFHIGIMLTRALGPPVATRIVLERIPDDMPKREKLEACGAVAITDASVPTFVAAAFSFDERSSVLLQLPDVDQLIGSTLLGHR